ncbi:TRAUB domain protein, partial [Ostertagia ostertagi]
MKDLMKTVDQDKHRRKAESVFAQTQTWEQLLYVKIKLQAALRAFNQLPRGQLAKDLLKEADEETKAKFENCSRKSGNLFPICWKPNTAVGGIFFHQFHRAVDSDDEEIESSDDETAAAAAGSDIESVSSHQPHESRSIIGSTQVWIFRDEEEEEREQEQEQVQHATSMSMKSLSKRICESEEQFAKFRDSTLVKWEGRTRLIASRRPKNASTDFSAFEKENIVCSDKQRLVKRSRVKKSDISSGLEVILRPEEDENFDMMIFYQVLLKELISKKSNNTQDPVAMTRHYIEMQKLKSKRARRKEIDNRASKDRKIKQLVNFHPAMPEMVEWSHETRNELFKSLFS